MNLVRPFRSRLVRQGRTTGGVTPMVESPVPDRLLVNIDTDAYDEATDSMYVYRQQRGADVHVGVVCDVHHEAFDNGQVRGHESVRPDRVEALMRYFATAPARPELVALLHHAGPVVTEAMADTSHTPPALRFSGPDGLEQTVWRLPADLATALSVELSGAIHYLADGHHRVAASLALWRSAGGPDDAGLPCVVYPMDGLRLSAFHRRVTGPVDPERLLDLVAACSDVREVAGPETGPGGFGLYVAQRWFRASFGSGSRESPDTLDVAVLHDRVLSPLTEASRPPSAVVPVRAPLTELMSACDGDDGALFTLSPPALDVLTTIADRGDVMPLKTTYFQPKPYAGIFLRPGEGDGECH
ncbi:MAG: DUF1015 family protein [Mycobacteriales bacterium]